MKTVATLVLAFLGGVAAFAEATLASWAEFGNQQLYPAARAAADLRSFQYRIVRFSAADGVNVASNDVSADAFEIPSGVLQNNPNSGQACSIAYMGHSKVVAGAAIAARELITTNGSGKAVEATSGDIVIGRAIEAAGAENDVIGVMLFPPVRGGSVA